MTDKNTDPSKEETSTAPRSGLLAGLDVTDPELTAYFGDFADETVADAAALAEAIDERTRLLVQLGAALAAGGLRAFRVLAIAAIADGSVSPVELKELVYQGVAYVGMARTDEFLSAANEVLADAGVKLPLPGQSAWTPQTRLEHGKTVQARIVGGPEAVQKRIDDAPADEAHFQRYLAANCFGDTVGRNLAVGNTRAQLLAVLTVLVPLLGYPRTLNALAAVDAVTGN